MSVEEWIDESNAIPGGVITIPTKEQAEKRNTVLNEMIEHAKAYHDKMNEEGTLAFDVIAQEVESNFNRRYVKAREMKRRLLKLRTMLETQGLLVKAVSQAHQKEELPYPGKEVKVLRMKVYFRVIPIKRKLNRYSKRYMRRFCMRAIPVQFEND